MRILRMFAFSFMLFGASLASAVPLCSGVFLDVFVGVSASVLSNKFVTSRDLYEYRAQLHKDFSFKVDSLTAEGHWIDLGAGKANAQIDFLRGRDSLQRPLATAVAYKLDRWFSAPKFSGRLQIKEGAFETQRTSDWAKADVITDFFGVLSYSKDMTTSLQKTFDLLKVGGELYIYSTPWVTRFKIGEQTFTLTEFLSQLPGVRVEGQFGTLKITKLQQDIHVPEMLLTTFKEDMPPSRTFTLP